MVVQMKVNKISLVDARIDAGYNSQAELAADAGLAESTVWGAENGRSISYKSKRRIANALKRKGMHVEVDDLAWSDLSNQ